MPNGFSWPKDQDATMFDLVQKVPEFIGQDWSTVAKMLIGAFMVGFLSYGWVRAVKKASKAKIQENEAKRAEELEREKGKFYQEIADLRSQLIVETAQLRAEAKEAEQARDRVSSELAALQERMNVLESFDGKLWERDTVKDAPPFVPKTNRKTTLIAVINLKGGVGKTTLTANLGVAMAQKGHRVLMADLDFQGSLSRLCAGREELSHLTKKEATISRLLGDETGDPSCMAHVIQSLKHASLVGKACDFIAADDSLAEAELKAQARWLISKNPDARFLFRRAFHSPNILEHYDFVLFDCPPRLTTACVNALGCCDYLLVPVLLEQGSVETLPRTLKWLTDLPHVTRARLLGLVANRVEMRSGKLVASQGTIYSYLPETVKRSGYDREAIFKAVVRNSRAKVEEAANYGRIAALDAEGLLLFSELACEVEEGVRR
jgi:cellulose biosynthesis protein BcsQ